jgi:hypothetical protein
MNRSLRLGTKPLLIAMLMAILPVNSSNAETTSWAGSVKFSNLGNPSPETVQYFVGGCRGDYKDGTFRAFIDVGAFEGKTLRFTPGAADPPPTWRLVKNSSCAPVLNGSLSSTRGSTVEWQSAGSFLAIYFDVDSFLTESLDGYGYTLQVCPCDT